jgi:hypothetical protein
VQRTGCDPGVRRLDRTSFRLAAKATSAHLAHNSRVTGRTVYFVRYCANSSFRPAPVPLERPAIQLSQRHE